MRRLKTMALALIGLLLASAVRAESCAYADMDFGPYVAFALVDDVVVSPNDAFVLARKAGDESRIVFANGGGTRTIHAASDQKIVVINDHEIALADKGEWTALDVRSEARRPLGREARNEGKIFNRFSAPQGRIALTQLYPTVMLLKIMPANAGAYAQFRADMLNGQYCGADVASLKEPEKQRAGALFAFMLFDDISEGRAPDFAAWKALEKPVNAFIASHVFDAAIEAWCFRISEAAQADPVLGKIDPNKVWSFAWTAVAELFQNNHELIKPGDFGHFTDLSAYQRHDRLIATLLGTQPLAGGTRNSYGFYQQKLAEIDLRTVKAAREIAYDWTQGAKTYHASVSLSPRASLRDVKAERFASGARAGLLMFDKTLDPGEVENTTRQYRAYYEANGFVFTQPAPLADVVDYLTQKRPPALDYVIRDGHADGDDDDVIVLYPDGFVLRGEKAATGESVEFVYNLTENSKSRRLDYEEFETMLARRGSKSPLVYVDTSCWGVEKAWVSLSHFKASQLTQLASRTPVNQFRATGVRDATHIVLDAIRSGEDFTSVRRKLRATPDYASGKGDNFILPDESEYPQSHPLVKVRRELFVRENNGPQQVYFPDGYF